MTDKVRVLSAVILGLLVAAMITRNGDVAWLTLPVLTYLGIGLWQSPDMKVLRLNASRTIKQISQNGQIRVDAAVTVENASTESTAVCIKVTLPEYASQIDGSLMEWAFLRPGDSVDVKYSFTAARGDFVWENIQVTASDPLGVLSVKRVLPARGDIQVRPSFHKFKAIPLRPRSTLHSPGSIPARLGGNGTDFYGVREYHAGDPLRSLDWHQTARHPKKFFTREFEQEEIAEIGLILDARPSVELRVNGESLFEHGVTAAASLAEMFIHQGHRVSLMVFGKHTSIAFPGYGKIQLRRIMNCLSRARVEFDGHSSPHIDFLPIRMFPVRSMIIVISSLTSSDMPLYQRLRASGYQALLISPNPIDFAVTETSGDPYYKLAVRTTRIERRLILNSIAALQVPVIDWNVNQPLFPLVRSALTRSRGQGI
ncbi:MAG: DUF58 domain-containing protein [Chloroflexi bacterium]|nr:DUF58 domain-containing protein [Chloroflexota bacterium]